MTWLFKHVQITSTPFIEKPLKSTVATVLCKNMVQDQDHCSLQPCVSNNVAIETLAHSPMLCLATHSLSSLV